jgi:hypothetical protein
MIICSIFKNYQLLLKGCLSLIFIFSALRYDYGPDYKGYLVTFNSFDIKNPQDYYRYVEVGWIYLTIFFRNFNFYCLIIFLSFILVYSWYFIIKKLVVPKLYWLAIFLFLLDSNNFLISLSGLRQALAVNILMLSIVFLYSDSKISIRSLVSFISYLFHYSSIIASTLLLFTKFFVTKRMTKAFMMIIVIIYFIIFFSIDQLKSIFSISDLLFINEKYFAYNEIEFSKPSILNILIYALFLILILLQYESLDKKYKYFTLIYLFGLFFIPIGYIIPMAGRMIYYFLPISIVLFPKIIEIRKSILFNILFFLFITSILLVRQYQFWSSEYLGAYYNYDIIFNL